MSEGRVGPLGDDRRARVATGAAVLVAVVALAVALPVLGAGTIVLEPQGGPPGSTFQIAGSGFAPGQRVQGVAWDSEVRMTTDPDPIVVGPDGTFRASTTVPVDATLGPHTIVVIFESGSPVEVVFTVTEPPPPPTPTASPSPTPTSATTPTPEITASQVATTPTPGGGGTPGGDGSPVGLLVGLGALLAAGAALAAVIVALVARRRGPGRTQVGPDPGEQPPVPSTDECADHCELSHVESPRIEGCISHPVEADIARGDPIPAAAVALDVHRLTLTCDRCGKRQLSAGIDLPDPLSFTWAIESEALVWQHIAVGRVGRRGGWENVTSELREQGRVHSREDGYLLDAPDYTAGRLLEARDRTASGEQVLYVPPYFGLYYRRSDHEFHRRCSGCVRRVEPPGLHITRRSVRVTLSCTIRGTRCGATIVRRVSFLVEPQNPLEFKVRDSDVNCTPPVRQPLSEDTASGEEGCVPRFVRERLAPIAAAPIVATPVGYEEAPLVLGITAADLDRLTLVCEPVRKPLDIADALHAGWQPGVVTLPVGGDPLCIVAVPPAAKSARRRNWVDADVDDHPFADEKLAPVKFRVDDRLRCTFSVYARTEDSPFNSIATMGHSWVSIRHWHGDEVGFGRYLAAYVQDDATATSGPGLVRLQDSSEAWNCRKRYEVPESVCRRIRAALLARYADAGHYNALDENCVDFARDIARIAGPEGWIGSRSGYEGNIDTPGEMCDAIRWAGGEMR